MFKKIQKSILFLDIDGTLIQPNQKPNSQKLPSAIKRLSKKGVLFGLNSNRALEDILLIKRELSLNGPIVLENGVYFIQGKTKNFLLRGARQIQGIALEAAKIFAEENNLHCKVLIADTVKVIRSKTLMSVPLIILVNKNRKYTGSIHIFRYGKHDRVLAKKMVSFLKKVFLKKKMRFLVQSPGAFGNVVFWPKDIDKGKALKKMKKYYKGYRFYMVGDDPADLQTLNEIDGFFAVGNAQKEVIERASYASKKTYTKGVIDILHYFEKRYC